MFDDSDSLTLEIAEELSEGIIVSSQINIMKKIKKYDKEFLNYLIEN